MHVGRSQPSKPVFVTPSQDAGVGLYLPLEITVWRVFHSVSEQPSCSKRGVDSTREISHCGNSPVTSTAEDSTGPRSPDLGTADGCYKGEKGAPNRRPEEKDGRGLRRQGPPFSHLLLRFGCSTQLADHPTVLKQSSTQPATVSRDTCHLSVF